MHLGSIKYLHYRNVSLPIVAVLNIAGILLSIILFNSCNKENTKSTGNTDSSIAMKKHGENNNNSSSNTMKDSSIIISVEEARIKQVVSSWLECWQKKDLECFKSYITNDYVFAPSNEAKQNYKARLTTISRHFKKRTQISITHDDFIVELNDNNAIVSFYQTYSSDEYSDNGFKKVYLRFESNSWKIYMDTFEVSYNESLSEEEFELNTRTKYLSHQIDKNESRRK